MHNFFTNKKILITGHTGFKGAWLCQILLLFGAKILGISKDKFDEKLFKSLEIHDRIFKSINLDLNNYKKTKKEILKFKPELVFHLAAQSLVIPSIINPKKTLNNNINSSLNLFEISKKLQSIKSFVCITSDKCYEVNNELKRKFKENDKLGGSDPYSISKACTELIFKFYRDNAIKSNIGYASARAGNIIGGGDFTKYRLIPDVLKAYKNKKKLVLRDPNNSRPWQYILDCLFGYLTLSKKLYLNPHRYSKSWNFGPKNSNIKAIDIIKIIKKNPKFNHLKVEITKNKFNETKTLALNTNKTRTLLGFYNKISINLMLKKTLEWYDRFYFNKKNIIHFTNDQIKNYISMTNRLFK